MNHRLDGLHPYPFERLNALLSDITPASNYPFIPLSLGEPKHPAPDFLMDIYADREFLKAGVGNYPPTKGSPEIRQAIATFVNRRFKLTQAPINAETQVLPVTGTREALFAFAQAVIDSDGSGGAPLTLMPNPFYQIYEGAAILAGSKPYYLECLQENDFQPDFDSIDDTTWQQCSLIYICSPGNPTGSVMPIDIMQKLIHLSDKFDFVIASDECYSEIYRDESNPPPGLLQACDEMGRDNYKNCVAFNSLSKRSNLPGLRSGYVVGDESIISRFLLYRTYHGSAMSSHHQALSAAAWLDEEHVIENRMLYRQKFDAVADILSDSWPMDIPAAGFYFWPKTPCDDLQFTRKLLQHTNIKVLPGSYLSRVVNDQNPGQDRIRMALVATTDECVEAAQRIKTFIDQKQYL